MPGQTLDVSELPLNKLNLPQGYDIEIYAEVPNARSMAISPSGTVFVGNRRGGTVYAITEKQTGDREVVEIINNLDTPNGVAFKNGDLYVAEISRILKFEDIENNLSSEPDYSVIYNEYPTESHHGWKYIAFGPDGWLYIPVGAPCNICNREEDIFASITRLNVETGEREIYARGVRNSVGFTWNPTDNNLWFTDNGRDMLGDNTPPCELNVATGPAQHFGYPFCHGGTIPDPEFGKERNCETFVEPAQNLGPHVAPLGVKFVGGKMFDNMENHLLIAEHGSWNRSKKIGYRITKVEIEGNKGISYEPFIDGWLDQEEQKAFGRPVDLLFKNDGSLLISDDYAGVIYRVFKGD